MVLVLFYIEDLKSLIIESIRATDRLSKVDRLKSQKRVLQTAFDVLVDEQVITATESNEIQRLIDYRNIVAHEMHNLTGDVGSFADRHGSETAYDSRALHQISAYRNKIVQRMAGQFVISLSFRPLKFEAAERTYLREIKRLRLRIKKRAIVLSQSIDRVNLAIKSLPADLVSEVAPGHPRNRRGNGTLTIHGANCCFKLFDAGATSLAVAHLMRISLRAARTWEAKWARGKG
ncbi:MAG TPA: hypothetical protein VJ806_15240 [Luteimonas sp.]|nr:hypothetical protein [Luteimonas sp.]